MPFNEERFKRQILLKEVGVEGQLRLNNARVIVIGAGGLGSPVLMYLAAAGIGHLGIVDGDVVSESNLNRQILYGDLDIGLLKAEQAKKRISEINGDIDITAFKIMLTWENAAEIIRGYDCAVFCLDNIESRRIANKACVELNMPYVEAGIDGFNGIMTTVVPGVTPCYECLRANAKNIERAIPVLGAVAGIVGSMQALAVIRLILGVDEPSIGRLVITDGLYNNEMIEVKRNPQCAVCGRKDAQRV
ncbi:MAG: HesA/MoeB/ThiF family protein [Clostridiales bacterium]|jgi:adenylyltransferase/sulfurtransferase|nr:HesA/MoeB/ThiF family protein [Clostridiales bacterium]